MTLTKNQVLEYLEATEYYETIWQTKEQIKKMTSRQLLKFVEQDEYLVMGIMDFYRNN